MKKNKPVKVWSVKPGQEPVKQPAPKSMYERKIEILKELGLNVRFEMTMSNFAR